MELLTKAPVVDCSGKMKKQQQRGSMLGSIVVGTGGSPTVLSPISPTANAALASISLPPTVRPSIVIGGSRECSHHFLSIDISAPRLRPRIPKSCGASAPTPLVDSSLPNTPEESFSATRLPPLCRAGVDWSLLLLVSNPSFA
uniref:Uncharacterized protein n=1 Tax=Zea mays TaxID=4577 RepID=A0A804RJS8_MAIZE